LQGREWAVIKNSIYTRSATEQEVSPVERIPLASLPHSSLSVEPPPPRKISAIVIASAVVLLAAISFIIIHYSKPSASGAAAGQTVAAQRKDFIHMLRLTGTTEAVRSRPILAPRLQGAQLGAMVVTKLIRAGTHVRKGDVLVEFDQQAQVKDYLDKKAAYQDLVDQVIEKRSAEDSARAKDETDLKQAEDALTKAQLEVSKNEIASRIDAEKNQEALEEAQANLKQLQETFKLKRQAAAADIFTLQIQSDRAQATMLYSQSNAQKMTISSPMDGVVVLNTIWLGGRMGEVQQGDQVRPGVPFMKVVDPSEMNIRANVNEADLLRLSAGNPAQVYLDAYPGLSFPATLDQLAPLGQNGQFSDKVRTFAASFAVHGNNPKLMPDLSAAVDINLQQVKNAIVIPRGSVATENGQNFVWLKTRIGFEKHPVKTGAKSDLETVIESGLNAGDVIRENTSDAGGAS
jgi:multidrug efflux pump subunit AcrA (membrane-fusion protein)